MPLLKVFDHEDVHVSVELYSNVHKKIIWGVYFYRLTI